MNVNLPCSGRLSSSLLLPRYRILTPKVKRALGAARDILLVNFKMKTLIYALAFPAYLALTSNSVDAHAVNTTSNSELSTTKLAVTGSHDHRHHHTHMHARVRAHHRYALKSGSALFTEDSEITSSVNEIQGLKKRELSRLTFFTPGLGACGGRNTKEDFVSFSI